MTHINSLFDSFVLERMLWELSVSSDINNDDNSAVILNLRKLHELFLNPDFIIQQLNEKSSQTSENLVTQIDILKLYESLMPQISYSENTESTKLQKNISPRSLDYQDERLFTKPENIVNLIVEKKKLTDKCFVYVYDESIIFDCNYEQISLIAKLIEDMIEPHPLMQVDNQYLFTPQTIFPSLTTHSYYFSFELSKELMGLLLDRENWEDHDQNDLSSFNSLFSKEAEKSNYDEFRPFIEYEGIYVSLSANKMTNGYQIRYYVSNEFTKKAMILDRTAVFKTSLKLLEKLISAITSNQHSKLEEIKKLQEELQSYSKIS